MSTNDLPTDGSVAQAAVTVDSPDTIWVGIGECVVAETPVTLRTHGLGSCVGIAVYDEDRRVAGMAHVLLPADESVPADSDAKYAASGVRRLVNSVEETCDGDATLRAAIAGGGSLIDGSHIGNDVGTRNVEVVRTTLAELDIPVVKADVGGQCVRKLVVTSVATRDPVVTIDRTTMTT